MSGRAPLKRRIKQKPRANLLKPKPIKSLPGFPHQARELVEMRRRTRVKALREIIGDAIEISHGPSTPENSKRLDAKIRQLWDAVALRQRQKSQPGSQD